MTDHETTWDGLPISKEPPFGASVVVYRRLKGEIEFLVLHRAHASAEYDGDWAWTPPAGARLPKEPILECAKRELKEETGLELPLQETAHGSEDWCIYIAEMDEGAIVNLDAEHDRFEWLAAATAVARCKPAVVSTSLEAVRNQLMTL